LLHDEHVGGDSERDALILKGEDDAAAQLAENAVALVGANADVDRVDDFAAADVVDAENVGVGDGDVFECRVVTDVVGESAEDRGLRWRLPIREAMRWSSRGTDWRPWRSGCWG
jgi:hypothetical protein